MRVEPPLRVRVRAGAALGRGLEARGRPACSGEFQTRELLARAGGGGSADGRGGLGRGPLRAVAPRRGRRLRRRLPARRGAGRALALGHAADAREFAAKLRQWVRDGLGRAAGRR